MQELKIKEQILKQWIEKHKSMVFKYASENEPLAKCHMYLGDKEQAKICFQKTIEWMKAQLEEKSTLPHDKDFVARRVLNIADCYRILSDQADEQKYLLEALAKYKALYTGIIKEKPDTFKGFYIEFSSIYYFLGRYQEAYDIGKLVRRPLVVPPRGYALGILKQDKTIIEKTLEEVMEYIKDDRILPYYNSLNLDDPWEWYEIGRQLLGLPSVLDMFKEEKA